jgi:methylenetetrahydrofolate reductase (NADPH)
MIKSTFDICSLAHFTCRDYTIEEIENNLMDHHYFGVTNILALRGDPPDGQPDHFKPAPNRHSYAWQLVEQISKLNEGEYLVREGFDKPKAGEANRKGTPMNFCIGVAAHPEHEPHEDAVSYLEMKAKMGAQFAITQMIFDAAPYERFIASCATRGVAIPVIPGLRIVTQAATAERMATKFGVKIPPALFERLSRATSKEDGRAIGLDYARELCERLLKAGAPGLHVFVMNDEKTGAELLSSFK